jgi:hypothetical protein
MITTVTNIDYLIPTLRLHLGDIDSASYRYIDDWLRTALVTSVKVMQRWWTNRYLVDSITYDISRSSTGVFSFNEPPIIQDRDERPIILMASILVRGGQLEANSWNVGSWKDAEISVSTIESSRAKQFGYGLDWEELQLYIKPPTKQLFGATRISFSSPNDVE